MSDTKDEKNNQDLNSEDYKELLDKYFTKAPNIGDMVKGNVISASKSEVKLDIDGVMTGIVRGPELYEEDDDYANLKPGDSVEATVIDQENENGDLELSFRYAGQEKAWSDLREAYAKHTILKIKVVDSNKGGLLVKYRQIPGFLPVSQLAPENYPRVNGGDKGKILERLRSFAGRDFEAKVMTLEEKEDKIIFSEKEAWNEKQKDVINKYKVGTAVEGDVTAVTDFGVFISFGENLEGLIHISELAWQRIDDPADLFRVGDKIKAEVISVENSKIFLSAKKLIKDPWHDVEEKFKVGETVKGTILKVNPFGLFVSLNDDIHGLAHISQLDISPKEKITDRFKVGDKENFEIVSIESKDHRLGLAYNDKQAKKNIEKEPVKAEAEDKKKATKEKPDKTEKKAEKEATKKPVEKKETKKAKTTSETKSDKKTGDKKSATKKKDSKEKETKKKAAKK